MGQNPIFSSSSASAASIFIAFYPCLHSRRRPRVLHLLGTLPRPASALRSFLRVRLELHLRGSLPTDQRETLLHHRLLLLLLLHGQPHPLQRHVRQIQVRRPSCTPKVKQLTNNKMVRVSISLLTILCHQKPIEQHSDLQLGRINFPFSGICFFTHIHPYYIYKYISTKILLTRPNKNKAETNGHRKSS